MAFPAGLTLVTVTARIDDFPDGGSTGVAIFAAPYDLIGPADGSIVPAPYCAAPFDVDGTLTVVMPANDDPGWSPSDWTYDVTIRLEGGRTITGAMALSVDDTTVNLAEVLNVGAPPTPASTYATIAALNALGAQVDGKLDQADLDAGLHVSNRWFVSATGGMDWAPASGSSDLNLYRAGAGVLQTDYALNAASLRYGGVDVATTINAANRALVVGESVLNRQDVNSQLVVESGTLFLTHFTATKTETITKIRTTTGDTPTIAVGGTHAWIGIMEWDGTNYIPRAISVDDPTRWAAPFASYETPISTFDKVAGHEYALEILWIGSGNPPQLPARSNWYADVLTEPRLNALLFSQVAPPSSSLSGAFVGPDSRRFQGILLP